jgi:hypothetical protein
MPALVTRSLGSHRATDQGFHAYQMLETVALQTADIARRLMRGGELYQEEGASS